MSQEIIKIVLEEKSGRDQYVRIFFTDKVSERYLLKNFPYAQGGPVIFGSYDVQKISKK